MTKKNLRFILSAVSLFSILFVATSSINAAPVRFNQVTQVVNAKPGKAKAGNYTRLRLSDNVIVFDDDDDDKDDKKGKGTKTQQDDRVIKETSIDIVEADDCNCIQDPKGGFPYWTLLGLGAVPLLFLIGDDDDPDPTPTPTPPGSPTPTPPGSPTPTPTTTPTPTPPTTPTPTPPTEPVPEPMTILLFGTGLAGVGLAARRKFGRKEEDEGEE